MLAQNGYWEIRSDTTGCLSEMVREYRPRCQAGRGTWRVTVLLGLVILALLAQGCASAPPRVNPLPEELYTESQIPGIPNARYWGDAAPPFAAELVLASSSEMSKIADQGPVSVPIAAWTRQ